MFTDEDFYENSKSIGSREAFDTINEFQEQLSSLKGQEKWYLDLIYSSTDELNKVVAVDPTNVDKIDALRFSINQNKDQLEKIRSSITITEAKLNALKPARAEVIKKDERVSRVLEIKRELYGYNSEVGLIAKAKRYEDEFINAAIYSGVLTEEQKLEYFKLDQLTKGSSRGLSEDDKLKYELYRKQLIKSGMSLFAKDTAKLATYENLLIQIADLEKELNELLGKRNTPVMGSDPVVPTPVTPNNDPKTVTVTFDGNGGKFGEEDQKVETVNVGDMVVRPEDPVMDDEHEFDKWLLDGQPFDFTQPVNSDIKLTASYRERTKAVDDGFRTITFRGLDGSVYKEVKVRVDGYYNGQTPIYDTNGNPIKEPKMDGDVLKKDKRGNIATKKTSCITGWVKENGEKVDFKKDSIKEDMVIYPSFGFDWKRIAAVGVGALATTVAMTSSLSLPFAPVAATSLGVSISSFVMKSLTDRKIIKPKEIISSVKYASLPLKEKMTIKINNSLKNRYFWDRVMHLGVGGAMGALIGKAFDDPQKAPEQIEEDVPTQQPVVADNTEKVEVFKDVDHKYISDGRGYARENELGQYIGDNGQETYFIDDAGNKIIPGETPMSDIQGGVTVYEVQDGITTPGYAKGASVALGYYDASQLVSETIDKIISKGR